ncbi:glucans biosynthesis glucosyltransferase MdoH [Roseicitreum antarcticum]|uniref:Glucans biosynthesis glucosyltransferase H n=1 Tax=Roseicitreum antarcticum TaxID=564137 RepID=A0A1H2TRC7_9RHOB|nr:glucans biosynthesis glucosyltransferase MdoH [Roseicitreum antarcticum]SDW46372.1 membrane glycosyltransferase [Roseicitreum antarcticum]
MVGLRVLGVVLALVFGFLAAALFIQYAAMTRLSEWFWLAAVLLGISTAWLAWGAYLGALGLAPMRARPPEAEVITARTVVLVPICNEDALTTFARVAAMQRQLAGAPAQVDFAILSDTGSTSGAQAEEAALTRLLADAHSAGGMIYYRRRTQNTGRKAGNIADFITRSGAAWDFALVLDADSLMEAATILQMIRRMEAAPDLTLLQSLPRVVRARSVFGRAMQFASGFHGPVFTRGLARLQGRTGPYWGHNALVRIPAFAASCGLPELPGRAPSGGHILSHDYVEAALLARAGGTVRVDPDLGGSYEEAPENVVAHARRDRRWCQGNLQHARLLRTRGLRLWSRAIFVQGIMSYLASGLWATFLIAALLAGLWQAAPDYFPGVVAIYHERIGFLPVLPVDASGRAIGLLIGVFGLLLLPKLLVTVEAAITGRTRAHGGTGASLLSVLAELALSAALAPVLMAYQVRSVLQVVSGQDGGWPPNARGDGALTLAEAWAAAWFITLTGAIGLGFAATMVPQQLPWLLPVLVPMLLAPVLIAWTSRPGRHQAVHATPEERDPPAILALHDAILNRWQQGATADAALAVA